MSNVFRNGKSLFQAIGLDNAAILADEPVRKAEYDAGISGVSPLGHTHALSDIENLNAELLTKITELIVNSDSVTWTTEGSTRKASVRLKSGGGLLIDGDGLSADVGVSGTQVAAGNHTHAQLHDPVTLASGLLSITASLDGQELTLEVKPDAFGGLLVGPSGVGVDYTQVARKAHTHGEFHDPVTIQSSTSLSLSLVEQLLSGSVRRDQTGTAGRLALGLSAEGLFVPVGQSGTEAATGDHTHAEATAAAAGFMSAADKTKLDQYGLLLQVEQSISFHKSDVVFEGETIGGRHRFGHAMQVLAAHVTAKAPTQAVTLSLDVGGSSVETFVLPGGAAETEQASYTEFTGRHVAKDEFIRVSCLSGVGVIQNEAYQVDVTLRLRPSAFTVQDVRVNSGGAAAGLYALDAFYSGGVSQNSSATMDTTGVTDPAPQAVYQTGRYMLSDSTPLDYTFTGLAKGLDYKVRLHFCDFVFDDVDENVFKIEVIGATTSTLNNYDIIEDAGGKNKAKVREFTLRADAAGQIIVRLTPLPNGVGQYNASINGIELIFEETIS